MTCRFGFFSLLLLAAPVVLMAESKNPTDYPLRIHIFRRDQTTFYMHHMLDEAKGEGRANLFENGSPLGVDFSYDCSKKLPPSIGYETYPARWEKQGQKLTVLFPEFGKTNAYWTCTLHTGLKDTAYVSHNGSLGTESSEDFRAWMVKHDYDPEHGKNTPVHSETPAAGPAASGSPAASAPPPQ